MQRSCAAPTLEYWRCFRASMKVPEKMLSPSRRPALSSLKFFSTRYDGQLSLANLQQPRSQMVTGASLQFDEIFVADIHEQQGCERCRMLSCTLPPENISSVRTCRSGSCSRSSCPSAGESSGRRRQLCGPHISQC
jgi:hypothetical protein